MIGCVSDMVSRASCSSCPAIRTATMSKWVMGLAEEWFPSAMTTVMGSAFSLWFARVL